jgi:hypothetical protein
VAAGSGDFEGTFGDVLAADVFEVVGKVLEFVEQGGGFDLEGLGRDGAEGSGVEQFADFEQGVDGVDVDAFDDRGLASVGGRNDEITDAGGAGGDRDRQHSLDGAKAAVEAEFAHEEEIGNILDM